MTARSDDLVDPLGEHAFRLACKSLDGELELAAEPPRRVLARRADRRVELLRRRLRVSRGLARDAAPELLELAVLDVAELRRDPLDRLGLLAVDLLLQSALAEAEPVGELLERLPPLDPVLLEVGGGRRRHLLRAPRQVLAQLRGQGPVLFERRLQLLGVGVDPPLDLGRQLHLALREPRNLLGEALLKLVQVAAPLREPLLHPPLRRRQRLDQPRRGVALALGYVGPALLHDPPLLVGERRKRLRPGESECPLEVGRAALDLERDDLVEGLLAPGYLVLERARGRARAPHRQKGDDCSDDRRERGGECDGGSD